jgi:hypothetical protein
MTTQLTTLANFKAWLNITSSDPARDALITRLIEGESAIIENELNRTFTAQTFQEVRDGGGAGASRLKMVFAFDPVSTVSYVSIDGVEITASPDGGLRGAGYAFDDSAIWLAPTTVGGFTRGQSNVVLRYVGGFLVLPYNVRGNGRWLLPAEVATIPATPYQITPQFVWLKDNGVQFTSNSTALVKVASSPITGQYAVSAVGVYTFAAADTGKEVALSYSYVPKDVEQSCIELVALRFKERERVGLVSQSVGTESVSFYTQKAMPDNVARALQQYKRTFVL